MKRLKNKNGTYKENLVRSFSMVVLALLNMIITVLCFVFAKNDLYLKGISAGISFSIIFLCLIDMIVSIHDINILDKEIRKSIEEIEKCLKD